MPPKIKKPRRTVSKIIAEIKIVNPATGLPATWKCGNHEPADIATSIQEIVDLTKNKGCKNWQSIS